MRELKPGVSAIALTVLLAPVGALAEGEPAGAQAPEAPVAEGTPPAAEGAAVAEGAAAAEGETAAEEEEGIGLSLSLGYSSAYYWRGINLFGKDQGEQAGMINPAVSYAFGDFSISYWGAFQTNGEFKDDNNDGALAAEQDLVFGWEHALDDAFTLSAGLGFYFYPMQDKDTTGESFPFYLEPSFAGTWSGAVDVKLTLWYYHGVWAWFETERYLYINPSVSKSFELNEMLALDVGLNIGRKIYTADCPSDDSTCHDVNLNDAVLAVGLPIAAAAGLTITPSVSVGWTELDQVADGDGVKDAGIGDEIIAFGGLNVSYEL